MVNTLKPGFNTDTWSAKWIWKSTEIYSNDFAYLRKEFDINKPVKSAAVYVSAHNHFELFVNGTKVSGYVVPAPTNPEKSKYYLSYDIGSLLKEGKNAFGAVVHYIGGEGQNYVDGMPGFILQCEISYGDGNRETFVTDESWKVLKETPYRNYSEFQQNRRMSAIEDFDSRSEPQGWLKYAFDDSSWHNAVLSPIDKAQWVLKPQAIPEGGVHEIIVPTPIGVNERGVQVFDTGKIITGWPRLELKGIEGVTVRTRYSEDLDGEGRVKHNVTNEKSENYYDQYTMRGEELEVWEPSLSYKAFRYIEVTGYPEFLDPSQVKIISAGTRLVQEGFFNSSNSLLNEIYKACVQTQKNNVVGQMVDCPHREQAQYLADSDLQAETFMYNFLEPSVVKKVLMDFKDAQFEDGRFPFVYPSNIHNKDFDIKIPEWDFHFITLLWKIYNMYEDQDIIKACYDTAKRTVNYYLGVRDKATGLIAKGIGFPKEWNISDHPILDEQPYVNIDQSGEFLTVENCLAYYTARIMYNIASMLNYKQDAADFLAGAEKLKESIVKHLYNKEERKFVDSFGSEQIHQGTNVVAYQYGLVPEQDKDAVLNYIVQQGFSCSTLLGLNLLQVLFDNGKKQQAYDILSSSTFPSWGYMIEKGFKTIWEGFVDIYSHCHAWNAYPARLLVEYIVGIKAGAPGFKEIHINPYIPEGLSYAEGKVPTAAGEIYTMWQLQEGYTKLEIKAPSDTTVKVFIPKTAAGIKTIKEADSVVWENGNLNTNEKDIQHIEETMQHIILTAAGGDYSFTFC
jgi:alpha-L-rhamnosidase